MSLFDYADYGTVEWNKILFYVLTFGTCMGLFFTITQVNGARKAVNRALNREDLNTIQETTVHSELSPSQLQDKINDAKLFGKRQLVNREGKLRLDTSMSLKSWGEHISISWTPAGKGYEYTIKSKPILVTTISDWGVGLKNVSRILEVIRAW